MDRKIGEIFYDHNEERTQCVEAKGVSCVDLKENLCKYITNDCIEDDEFSTEPCEYRGRCAQFDRSDKKNVVFISAE